MIQGEMEPEGDGQQAIRKQLNVGDGVGAVTSNVSVTVSVTSDDH